MIKQYGPPNISVGGTNSQNMSTGNVGIGRPKITKKRALLVDTLAGLNKKK